MNFDKVILVIILHFIGFVYCEKKKLYVGVLLELTEHWYVRYTNFFPEVFRYGLEGVDNKSDILSDYTIELVIKDTKGKPGLAARLLTEMLQEDPPKVAIIGPTLSNSLTVTGQIVPFYNIIELSYIATTATTTDRSLFSTLFKVNQVANTLNPLRIKMMKHFGWSRVGTIAYQEEFSVSQIDDFHDRLRENNQTLVTSAVISDTSNIGDILKRYKQFGVRIIMAAFRGKVAPKIFCEVYHQTMYGDSYVWILSGSTLFDGWIDDADMNELDCTKEELIEATNGHFTLDHLRESTSEKPCTFGETPKEILNKLQDLVKVTNYEMSTFISWIYDTPWALALGLNNSIKYLAESGLQLHNYNYSSQYIDAVIKGMKEVRFDGVSGPVAFDETGSRVGVNFIQQNFYKETRNVASLDGTTGQLTWLVDSSSLWSGNDIPKDRFIYQEVLVPPSKIAFGLIVAINLVGCLLSITFLFFNIYFRNNRSIKMSSPMVNNVIITGCLLMYLEILVNAIDYFRNKNDSIGDSMCMIRTWLLSLGFTSIFGALFSKTYRVYVVFRDYKLRGKSIKDYHLFGMIGTMLVVDLLILVPWTTLFPLVKVKVSKNAMDVRNNNMIYSESYLHCYNVTTAYWIAALYVYKGLLLAFGTFLAWETRQVTIPVLNDSKFIGACIYNVVIACVFGVPLAHVLPIEQKTLSFVLESCLLFFCTTSSQCIIFIPKIRLRNQVHGKFLTSNVPTEATGSTIRQTGINPEICDYNCDNNKTTAELKDENAKLRLDIANESIAIARLRKSILNMTGNVHFYKKGTDYILFKSNGPKLVGNMCLNSVPDHSV